MIGFGIRRPRPEAATHYPAADGRNILRPPKQTHQARYSCMEYRFKVFARQHWQTKDLEAAIKWAMDTSGENGTHCQVYDNLFRETVFKIGPRSRLQQYI